MEVGLRQGITPKQSQNLRLSPKVQQSLTVLQLNQVELAEYLGTELLVNPVLELEEVGHESLEDLCEADDTANDIEEQWESLNEGELTRSMHALRQTRLGPGRGPDPVNPQDCPSIRDYLLAQIALLGIEGGERIAAEFVANSVDDDGYLRLTPVEGAAKTGLAPQVIHRAIKLVQSLEPPGVAQNCLASCLAAQLDRESKHARLAIRIIEGLLPHMARGRLRYIADRLRVSVADVQEAADLIHSLNPKPGRGFGRGAILYVVPDAEIKRLGDGYAVLVNDSLAGNVGINDYYLKMFRSHACDQEVLSYLEERLASARWLVSTVQRRNETLSKVVGAIVKYQRHFFDRRTTTLRPLTMQEVAGEIGLSAATVSRAVKNKYISTPRGTYPLKFFFSRNGIEGPKGVGTRTGVKEVLNEIITAEDPHKPLSDDELTSRIREQGYAATRRTVAKYRQEMGIPPARARQRF